MNLVSYQDYFQAVEGTFEEVKPRNFCAIRVYEGGAQPPEGGRLGPASVFGDQRGDTKHEIITNSSYDHGTVGDVVGEQTTRGRNTNEQSRTELLVFYANRVQKEGFA